MHVFKALNVKVNESEVQKLMMQMDADGSGR